MIDQRKVGQQLIDLRPEEQVAVPFRITAPPEGLHQGDIRIEADGLTEDDHFYFAFQDPRPSSYLDRRWRSKSLFVRQRNFLPHAGFAAF